VKAVIVIPALNEAANIAHVIEGLRAHGHRHVVVVDGGSDDGTRAHAEAAGAVVLVENRRGYGRACSSGAERALADGAAILAFTDGAGAEDPADLGSLLAPLLAGDADLVLGARRPVERGALRPLQRVGNRLATTLIWRLHGHRYTDLGSMRAIRADAFERLQMREMGHGWPVEMQLAALRCGLRVRELPIRYRRRRAGKSKVSGNLRGALRASATILRLVLARPGPAS